MNNFLTSKQDNLSVASENLTKIVVLVLAIGAVVTSVNQLIKAVKAFN